MVPAGLGTYANWDERLDGMLAQSVMSLQAVKAVEIGRGVVAAGVVWLRGYRTRSTTRRGTPAPDSALRHASRTMPAVLKAAYQMAKTWWSVAI